MYSKGTAAEDMKQGNPVLFDLGTGDVRRDVEQMCANGAAPEPAPKATIDQDGTVYQWVRYGQSITGEYVFDLCTGALYQRHLPSRDSDHIFRPVPVLHRFGPPGGPWIVLGESSKEQAVPGGSWILDHDGNPCTVVGPLYTDGGAWFQTLKPVSVEL